MYLDLGNQSQVFELTLKLGEIQQGKDLITKYFNSLKRLWQDLDLFNDYEWKSIDDCNHHKKMVEDNRIYKFFAGLNVEFDKVRGRIIGGHRAVERADGPFNRENFRVRVLVFSVRLRPV